jgi:hypothetical protein
MDRVEQVLPSRAEQVLPGASRLDMLSTTCVCVFVCVCARACSCGACVPGCLAAWLHGCVCVRAPVCAGDERGVRKGAPTYGG